MSQDKARRSFLRLVGSVLGAGLGTVAFGGTTAASGSGAGTQWCTGTDCVLVACKHGGCTRTKPNYFRCTDYQCGGGTYYMCANLTCRNHCFQWC